VVPRIQSQTPIPVDLEAEPEHPHQMELSLTTVLGLVVKVLLAAALIRLAQLFAAAAVVAVLAQ
jgi:hypothetical protein